MGREDLQNLIRVDDLMALVYEHFPTEPQPPASLVKEEARSVIAEERKALLAQESARSAAVLAGEVCQRLKRKAQPSLRHVVNATGVIIHTNLGRSVLAQPAVEALIEVARGYSTLEYDLHTGERGSRHDHISGLIAQLTGGEDAVVVNNNASAVLLVLAALSAGGEAIISRGQLVEIGGSFRIPDIMRCSNTQMCEVGCTNKTHVSDYEQAINERTRLMVKVHPSNFKMVGFVDEPSAEELANLAHHHNLPLYEDQGSGALFSLDDYALPVGNTVAEALNAGVDVVSFSGDKLLGGPQAGIIVGSKELMAQIKAHPFMRAMRVDKLTLAALEATLRLSLDEQQALTHIPTLSMLSASPQKLYERARALCELLNEELGHHPALGERIASLQVVESINRAGGGALPEHDLHGYALELKGGPQVSLNQIHAALRRAQTPIIAYLHHDALYFDSRTMLPGDDRLIVEGIIAAFTDCSSNPSTES